MGFSEPVTGVASFRDCGAFAFVEACGCDPDGASSMSWPDWPSIRCVSNSTIRSAPVATTSESSNCSAISRNELPSSSSALATSIKASSWACENSVAVFAERGASATLNDATAPATAFRTFTGAALIFSSNR